MNRRKPLAHRARVPAARVVIWRFLCGGSSLHHPPSPQSWQNSDPLFHYRIPDDLTVPQFLLDDYKHPLSEMRKEDDAVWLIDDATGREYTFKEAGNFTVSS